MKQAREIDSINSNKLKYSICTLVTDLEEYQKMKNSFHELGFDDNNSEFIYVDNKNNKYDAYEGINKLINCSSGRYIIVCHQDIELLDDDEKKLDFLLNELYKIDSNWSVAGNAGGISLGKLSIRISDPHGKNVKVGNFPQIVNSLDENFLILRRDANLGLSHNLNGFHLYGTDICFLAKIRGYNSYVIDFHLLHKSPGNVSNDFFKLRKDFISKYQIAFKPRIIQTTCTNMFISSSRLLNNIMTQSILNKIKRIIVKK